MSEQTTLFGGDQPDDSQLGPAQRLVLDEMRKVGRLEPDEAGALVHWHRESHGREERCTFCARDGRAMLASLARRGFKNGRPRRAPSTSYDPATAEIPY